MVVFTLDDYLVGVGTGIGIRCRSHVPVHGSWCTYTYQEVEK